MLVALAAGSVVPLTTAPASAHSSPGYSHDGSTGTSYPSWMTGLPDELRLSELSLPGTHDSGAYAFGGDMVETQSMDIAAQLEAGIRAFDVRLRVYATDDELYVFHGFVPQLGVNFRDDIVQPMHEFLTAHPGEAVVMRVKYEAIDDNQPSDFDDEVEEVLEDYSTWYRGESDNPTLGELRGTVAVLQDFSSDNETDFGLHWGTCSGCMQDEYTVGDNWDLGWKWDQVRRHFDRANADTDMSKRYVNFLSASGGSFPYFIASGHSSPQTGADRLWTGLTDGGGVGTCDDSCHEDFPRELCAGDLCSVYFEGTNVLSMNYLVVTGVFARRAGLVYADFPGAGLIKAIIDLNPWNWPPQADAGGPYAVDEGMPLTLTAAGSTDRDGQSLTYRWDVDSDGHFDSDPSSSPTMLHTYPDDWSGEATVEVSDGRHASQDTADVVVSNVAPSVTATGQTVDEDETATVTGTIADPGVEDTFSVVVYWGEGAPTVTSYPAGTTSFSASHRYLDDDPTATASDTYPVTVVVTDDDGGLGSATTAVVVDDVAAVTAIDHVTDETGAEVGTGTRLVLQGLEVDVVGSFHDVGSRDSHTAAIAWGDGRSDSLGATTRSLAGSHVFAKPGLYDVKVAVTDDDTLTGTATRRVTVVNASDALRNSIATLRTLTGDRTLAPAVRRQLETSIARLEGQRAAQAANGALSLLDKRALVAAQGKIGDSLRYLAQAERASGRDLEPVTSLIALSAKSVAVTAIGAAESARNKPATPLLLTRAKEHVAAGDRALAAGRYVAAVDSYQRAVQGLR